MNKKFKLTIELVPRTSWGKNLRNQVPRRIWDKIRKYVYAEHGHQCGICGADGRLICHEIWEYDDLNYIQRLQGFIALCNLCDHVKHLGKATQLAAQGKLDMKKVEEHFMRINNCDLETFKKYAIEVGQQHKERSKHEWRLDLGEYQKLVDENNQSKKSTFYEDDLGPNPGDNMPNTCPNCGSVGTVVFTPDETIYDDESEGMIAEYEAGMLGSGLCVKCKTGFFWQS